MALVGRARGVKVLQHRLHFFARLEGRGVFIKYAQTDDRRGRALLGATISAERRALRVLQGLAVPALLSPSGRALRGLIERPPATVIVLERVEGKALPELKLPLPVLFGYWAALTEQLAAFRRRRVLYTDMKSTNVLAQARPPRLVVVDFNRVCPPSRSRLYPAGYLGYTPHYAAPEQGVLGRLPESSLVYQLGMTLAQSVDKDFTNVKRTRPGALRRLLARVRARGGPGLARLVEDCLDPRHGRRPADYDAVLARFYACLPRESVRVWAQLRRPYARALAELGFGDSR